LNLKPPKKVQYEIMRRARQYVRLAEREEDWVPIPVAAFILSAIGSVGKFLTWPIMLLLVMLGSLPDLHKSSLLQSPRLQEPANKAWADFLAGLGRLFAGFGFLRVVAHVFAWALVLLAVSFLVNGARDLWFLRGRREQAWREAVLYEYASNRPGRDEARPPKQRIAGVPDLLGGSWWRWFLRRWHGTHRGQPDQRLRHARRWARLDELYPLLDSLGALFTGFVCTTVLLWHYNVVARSEHFSWAGAILISAAQYSWSVAKDVPILEIPEALGWRAPNVFAEDTVQRVLILVFKVAIGAPIVAYTIHIFRDRKVDPRAELQKGGDALSIVAQLLADRGVPDYLTTEDWQTIHGQAAQTLNRKGLAHPEGRRWTAVDVYRDITETSP
jgi:hypothetical protein